MESVIIWLLPAATSCRIDHYAVSWLAGSNMSTVKPSALQHVFTWETNDASSHVR